MDASMLLNMTKSELEDYLNNQIARLRSSDTDASIVRNTMISALRKKLDPLVVEERRYDGTEFYIDLGKVIVIGRATSTRTKQTIKVSKLKKAYINQVGKFKIESILFRVNYYSFKPIEESDLTIVTFDSNYISSGCESDIDVSVLPGKTIDNLKKDKLIQQLQSISQPPWNDLRKGIINDMAQPFIKKAFIDFWRANDIQKIVKLLPKEYRDRFKSATSTSIFDVVPEVIGDINKELISKTIDKMFSNLKRSAPKKQKV